MNDLIHRVRKHFAQDNENKELGVAIQDRLQASEARVEELEAALEPFARYARSRDAMPLRGLGDSIHHIHPGDEHEAELTMEHVRRAAALLAPATPSSPSPVPEGWRPIESAPNETKEP